MVAQEVEQVLGCTIYQPLSQFSYQSLKVMLHQQQKKKKSLKVMILTIEFAKIHQRWGRVACGDCFFQMPFWDLDWCEISF